MEREASWADGLPGARLADLEWLTARGAATVVL